VACCLASTVSFSAYNFSSSILFRNFDISSSILKFRYSCVHGFFIQHCEEQKCYLILGNLCPMQVGYGHVSNGLGLHPSYDFPLLLELLIFFGRLISTRSQGSLLRLSIAQNFNFVIPYITGDIDCRSVHLALWPSYRAPHKLGSLANIHR
jgi:hypothetical protein